MQRTRTDSFAWGALVAGIVGLWPGLGLFLGLLAGALALFSFARTRRDAALRGRGIATAGLLLGVFDLAKWGYIAYHLIDRSPLP